MITVISLVVGLTVGYFIGSVFLGNDGKLLEQPKEIIKYVYLGGDPSIYKGTKYELHTDNNN